jgi:hypothetical protein
VQAVIGTIQVNALFLAAVIENDIETARHGYEELVAGSECVAATVGTSGNIIEIEDPLNLERDVSFRLDERQVASGVGDLR